jgi:anti-sigma regulatory factor (Ser/Thr protein kinase)
LIGRRDFDPIERTPDELLVGAISLGTELTNQWTNRGLAPAALGNKEIVKVTSTICFHADPAVFGGVRRFVAQFVRLAGGSNEEAAELELAAGEVLINAYCHAYRKRHGPLQLDMNHDGHRIEISLRDEGQVVAGALNIPSTLAPEDDHRGLYLVGKLTDHVDITHPRNGQGGTTVRMVKHVNKLLWLESILGLR